MYFEAMSAMLNRGWAPLTGVLVDRDKYIDLPLAERYDLTRDPAERVNRFGRDSERDRALAAALGGFNAAAPGSRHTEDPEAVARLRALGYVTGSALAKARYTGADDPKTLVELDRAVHGAVEAFGAGRRLYVLLIWDGEELIGIAPLMISRVKMYGLPVREIGFIYNDHTPRFPVPWKTGTDTAASVNTQTAMAIPGRFSAPGINCGTQIPPHS